MNIKEYISSGIVESYVLGITTEAERTEFESMCLNYSEVAEARTAFEVALENQLLKDAVTPPAHLKKAIEEKMAGLTSVVRDINLKERVMPMHSLNPWKWIAAASIILLAAAISWGIYSSNNYRKLETANRNLEEKLNQWSDSLAAIKQDEAMLHKPDVKMAAMHSTGNSAAYATIYWDTTSKDVYLMVNNLPQPSTDKQYQLWALLDGKPIDLGVFARQDRLLVRMKNVANAQAFAITLEPKGGSPTPTSKPVVLTKL